MRNYLGHSTLASCLALGGGKRGELKSDTVEIRELRWEMRNGKYRERECDLRYKKDKCGGKRRGER